MLNFHLIVSLFIFVNGVYSYVQIKNFKSNTPAMMLKPKIVKKNASNLLAMQGVGEEGCLLESPSKINTLPLISQSLIFTSIIGALFLGTDLLNDLFMKASTLDNNISTYFNYWKESWPLLRVIYFAAGIAHFKINEDFENIYPQKGTWGFWYIPGSAQFHVAWTGIAEIIGGFGLSIGALSNYFGINLPCMGASLSSDSALVLFLLTIAVTPANIYMFTHGARLPVNGPEVPLGGHLIRGMLHIVLLAFLLTMARPSIDILFNTTL